MRAIQLALLLTFVCPPLYAGPPRRGETAEEEVERLAADAIEAYKAARYDKAIALLNRAYAIRPLVPLLYNLAKAYDKINDVEKGYETYQKYVDSGEADPKLEKKARERMAALEAQYKEKKAQATTKPPEPGVTPKPATAALTPEEQAAKEREEKERKLAEEQKRRDEEAAREQATRDKKRKAMLGAAIGLTVLGIGSIGGGVGLYAVSSSKYDEFSRSRDEAQKRQLKSDTESLGLGSTVMYAVGGVLVVGSIYFWYAGLKKEKAPAKAQALFVPWVSPTVAGGSLTWEF
jgi:tetratricopeptide (TPR) repeat protein